jgi:hypothetical protein
MDISIPIDGELEEWVNQEARAVSLSLLTGLVRTTPVDTGRAKGNWFVSNTSSNRTQSDVRRLSQALSEGSSVISQAKVLNYPTITLSNNLPYIERLNDGSSTQAPAKFVENEITRVVNASNSNG